MILNIILPTGRHVKLGTFLPVHKDDIKTYIRKYERSWISFE